ncbi:MAG: hypothetical protein ABIW38_03115 [Ferruginibacter sp.]
MQKHERDAFINFDFETNSFGADKQTSPFENKCRKKGFISVVIIDIIPVK